MAVSEKVSPVGIRSQVTLPKAIRKGMKSNDKTRAGIQGDKTGNYLVITLQLPAGGMCSRVLTSEREQLVILKNMREPKGIREGMNLVFSLISDEKKIRVQKLLEKWKERELEWRWHFLVEVIWALEGQAGLNKLETEGTSWCYVSRKTCGHRRRRSLKQ
ncbi:MAG: hypothetical protein ACFFD4_17850 [Candidatus Odinarchaeota archaeon]